MNTEQRAERVEPRDLEQAAECLRSATSRRARVVPIGLGSKRGWTRPVAADVELCTRQLAGVIAHEPGDGTLTVLAGTRWSDAAKAARDGGHHLSPEIAAADGATVGGVLASAQSGFDRLRFGPPRHHVLGMRVMQGDGEIVQSGGRLVKNVTGYDLHRLHTGAHGTLGLVVEASLRLHALPELTALVTADAGSPAEALEIARALLAPPHEPWSVLVHDLGGGALDNYEVAAVIAGRADVVPATARALAAARGSLELYCAERETESAARIELRVAALRDLEHASGRWPPLRLACRPAEIERVWASLRTVCRAARRELRVLVHPGLATLDAWPSELDVSLARAIASGVRSAGAQVHWRGLDAHLLGHVDPFGGAEPAGLELMRALQAALDPTGTFARGRLAGGL